jgi:mannose-1-phosphate guanylyltransferase
VKKLRLRALVLAAGQGERLRPLTRFLPKPLLPVAGRPIASYTLSRLAALGCEAAALNLHHLGEQIRNHFRDSYGRMRLVYSQEEELLGTWGAISLLQDFFRDADLVLLINGDSLCRWPLRRLVRRHLSRRAAATLLLTERATTREFGGGVGIDDRGRVVHVRGARLREQPAKRLVFAGAQVLAPRLLERVVERPADIVADLYVPLLAGGHRLETLKTSCQWHDVGTPRRYLDGAFDWARGRFPHRLWRRNWLAKGARVEAGARVRGSVIESGVRVESGASIERSLILPGASIGRGSHLQECIVASGIVLPPETGVERRLITPLKAGRAPGANDSVLGNMVYTPIGDR